MTDLFRVYFDPAEIQASGYPLAWDHGIADIACFQPSIKDLVREQADHRCVRCGHPYRKGEHPLEEVIDSDGTVRHESWSPCDTLCTHRGPIRLTFANRHRRVDDSPLPDWHGETAGAAGRYGAKAEALWRVLTVHHLNGIKHDCRWWNLASLCQRCHLVIQAKVFMERPYDREHSAWFKPYAAGFYAWKYLGEELTREETMARLDELLLIERTQEALF